MRAQLFTWNCMYTEEGRRVFFLFRTPLSCFRETKQGGGGGMCTKHNQVSRASRRLKGWVPSTLNFIEELTVRWRFQNITQLERGWVSTLNLSKNSTALTFSGTFILETEKKNNFNKKKTAEKKKGLYFFPLFSRPARRKISQNVAPICFSVFVFLCFFFASRGSRGLS